MPITTQELQSHVDSDNQLTLVEALPASYYDAEHLPGAINIPHDEVDEHLKKLPANKDNLIVTYCSGETCQNSVHAAKAIRALGYTNVVEYVGGKKAWLEAGLPFEANQA